ncbi:hypothetical protein D3800_10155 [Microcystis aeruginosa NIES-298]|uniref:Uncharacterized protein n=2 Tax=Microcystis aeruginosa TaxID=1126 RepID=A0A402DGW0_MICAE|nr:hypothetical protein D3800_10155 [Microcystis aeruginosa NIES-298]REJ58811.1 MAG: hypothetical protein DWQ56_06640 [Microcystis aeruginosa DA14]ROH90779.1 hypothetical protein ED562_24430 [Microcystis aeruginosa FACHB-524]GBE98416.1 hypothetical protein NIES298_26640 [Microcystis aeruginosa NIES-298]GCE61424.1 hypothetical protein MiAbB_03360 [Microcystis aeruginosa NIES-4285]
MNDYSYLLYSEKSVLATDCYDLTPLTYNDCQIRPKTIRLSKIEQTIVNSRKNRQQGRSHDINCKGLLLTVLAQQSPIFQGCYHKN